VPDVVRMTLDSGASILVRADDEPEAAVSGNGPVKAGRAGERVEEIVTVAALTLRQSMEPVAQMSQQILDQLGRAKPHGIEVEFGIELNAEAGAILTRAGGACHLTVKLTWGAQGGAE
jgi:Trypsin-co-occurring domain 1